MTCPPKKKKLSTQRDAYKRSRIRFWRPRSCWMIYFRNRFQLRKTSSTRPCIHMCTCSTIVILDTAFINGDVAWRARSCCTQPGYAVFAIQMGSCSTQGLLPGLVVKPSSALESRQLTPRTRGGDRGKQRSPLTSFFSTALYTTVFAATVAHDNHRFPFNCAV